MTDLGPRFRIEQSLDHEEPPKALFLARVLDGGLRELRSDYWATSERSLEHLGRPVMRSVGRGLETVVLERDSAILHVRLHQDAHEIVRALAEERVGIDDVVELAPLAPLPRERP